jgi:hypothetical protein
MHPHTQFGVPSYQGSGDVTHYMFSKMAAWRPYWKCGREKIAVFNIPHQAVHTAENWWLLHYVLRQTDARTVYLSPPPVAPGGTNRTTTWYASLWYLCVQIGYKMCQFRNLYWTLTSVTLKSRSNQKPGYVIYPFSMYLELKFGDDRS